MTRQQVVELYEEVKYRKDLCDSAAKQLELSQQMLNNATMDYRAAEVDYVLGMVRHMIGQDKLSKEQIDEYLCHCQNCLNGNVDGTILDLEEEE